MSPNPSLSYLLLLTIERGFEIAEVLSRTGTEAELLESIWNLARARPGRPWVAGRANPDGSYTIWRAPDAAPEERPALFDPPPVAKVVQLHDTLQPPDTVGALNDMLRGVRPPIASIALDVFSAIASREGASDPHGAARRAFDWAEAFNEEHARRQALQKEPDHD